MSGQPVTVTPIISRRSLLSSALYFEKENNIMVTAQWIVAITIATSVSFCVLLIGLTIFVCALRSPAYVVIDPIDKDSDILSKAGSGEKEVDEEKKEVGEGKMEGT